MSKSVKPIIYAYQTYDGSTMETMPHAQHYFTCVKPKEDTANSGQMRDILVASDSPEVTQIFLKNLVGEDHFLSARGKPDRRSGSKGLVKANDNTVIFSVLDRFNDHAAASGNLERRYKVLMICANGSVVEAVSATNGIHGKTALVRVDSIAEVALASVTSVIRMSSGLVQGNTKSSTLTGDSVFYVAEH